MSEKRKFAVVTAGASGIGKVVVRELTKSGWHVAFTDVNLEAGEATAIETGAEFHRCDMADSGAIEIVFAGFPTVDLLLNNAGVAGPTLPVMDTPIDAWKNAVDINITSHFVCARAVLPGMIAQRRGVIVNMASVAAKIAYPNRAVYAATKWAVLGFTGSLAHEVGQMGIRVNAILPASVRGERIENVVAEYARANAMDVKAAEAHYLGRQATRAFIEPEEIAATILFLASDAARSITGQFIGVDGGFQ
ncbi:MAG: SDR family oxidoreductase [Rhizobiaceae bacterium]|nr:SDR family oxidoreductase [Rhizobiaceae bacterium]